MSQFKLGATYKMNNFLALMLGATVGAKFKSGGEYTFTVHEVNDDGSVCTDDITSPLTTARCKIPPYVIEDCELVGNAPCSCNACTCNNSECTGRGHG